MASTKQRIPGSDTIRHMTHGQLTSLSIKMEDYPEEFEGYEHAKWSGQWAGVQELVAEELDKQSSKAYARMLEIEAAEAHGERFDNPSRNVHTILYGIAAIVTLIVGVRYVK